MTSLKHHFENTNEARRNGIRRCEAKGKLATTTTTTTTKMKITRNPQQKSMVSKKKSQTEK